MDKNKVIAVDFDGVISDYRGWLGKGVFGKPIHGCAEFLKKLKSEGWIIIVFTTRSETEAVADYLGKHNLLFDYINYNPDNDTMELSRSKVIADCYLDDRGIRFEGKWNEELFDKITSSEPHWRNKINE